MIIIQTENKYDVIVERIEIILQKWENIENKNSAGFIELDLLSDLVADYEEQTYPVEKPSLSKAVRLRMAELGLNQKRLSEILAQPLQRICVEPKALTFLSFFSPGLNPALPNESSLRLFHVNNARAVRFNDI